MRQGEIRDLTISSDRWTVVIISSDTWSERLAPLVAPLRRGVTEDHFPALVALHDTDPYGGAVDLTRLGTVNPSAVGSTVHGVIGGQTMTRLRQAITAMIED